MISLNQDFQGSGEQWGRDEIYPDPWSIFMVHSWSIKQASLQLGDGRFHFGLLLRLFANLFDLLHWMIPLGSQRFGEDFGAGGKTQMADIIYIFMWYDMYDIN